MSTNKLLVLLTLLIFVISGCNKKSPPAEVNPDIVYNQIPAYDSQKALAPYSFSQYQSVLDKSKLQIYYDDVVAAGDYVGKFFPQFYADDEGKLHFVIDKDPDTYKTRSELREITEWSMFDPNGHFWVGTLKCLKPKVGVNSYTWMQIHGTNDTYNYPILRLFWERKRDGKYDHIWAVIIVSDPYTPSVYEYVDLGARPSDYFTAEVHIHNNIMDIIIDRKVYRSINIGYWQNVQNYFKAGVYINRYQDGGTVSAIFKQLHFYDDDTNIVSVHH